MLQELGLTVVGPTSPPVISRHSSAGSAAFSEACCWKDRTKDFVLVTDSTVPHCNGTRYQDTMELHKELEQTAEQCQMLADRLKRKGDNMNKPPAEEPDRHEEKQTNDVELKLRGTVAENIRLRQVLKDVTEVNKRWQKYNHERQDYVQRLLTTIQELQKRADRPVSLSSSAIGRLFPLENERHAPISYRHSDPSALDQSGEHAALRQSYESAVKENCRLTKELEETRSSLQFREQQLESAQKNYKEQMELLEIQIKAYKEDWEAEKREKEVALSKAPKLMDEISALRKKCRDYEDRLRQIERTCHCSTSLDENDWVAVRRQLSVSLSQLPAAEGHKMPYANGISREASSAPMPRVILRGAERGFNFSNDPNIVVDSAASPENPESFGEVTNDFENIVECPGCKKSFPSSQHVKFLDHFEQCQKGSC